MQFRLDLLQGDHTRPVPGAVAPIYLTIGPPVQRDAHVGRVGRGDDLVLYYQFHIFTLDAFSLRWRCGVPRVRPVVMYKLVRIPMIELELRRQQCEAGY